MEFQLSDCLEVFTGDVWIKVRAKLLSDVIILIPVHNTEDVAKFWNFYSPDFDVSLNTDAEEPRIVEIHKDKFTGLGISIKGGRESGTPIIISKIFEGMTAAKTGQLHVGNTILSVNGEDMRNASHDEAVRALKRAGQTITLEVKSLPKVSPFLRRMHACEGKARLNGRERSTLSKPDSLPNVATTVGGMPTQTRTTRSASVLGHFAVASPVARQIPLQLVHIEHPVSTRTRLSLGHNISAPSTPIPSASSSSAATASPPSGIAAAITRPDTSAAYDRCFELFSPDLTQSCLLRGSSRQQTNIWVAAISRQIQMLNQLHLDNLRQIMPQNQLRRIGWMMELVCSAQPSDSPKPPANSTADASHSWSTNSHRGTSSSPIAPNDATAATANVTWKPVFLAVSEDNLLLYHHAPLRLEEWQRPAHSNALIATRVVDVPPLGIAGSLRVPPLNSRLTAQTRLLDMLVFTVRTGKKLGVESHTFAVMTASDLETWLREIVNGAQKLLTSTSHLSIACRWRSLESRLLLHQDYGLTLVPAAGAFTSEAHTVDNGADHWTFSQLTNHSPSTVFWSFPFERLRSTADDGCSILWLNFGKDGEQELDLPGGAKPVVFVLLNMLSTKLLRRKASTYLNVDIPP